MVIDLGKKEKLIWERRYIISGTKPGGIRIQREWVVLAVLKKRHFF